MGYRKSKEIQYESIDTSLRNRLWNAIIEIVLTKEDYKSKYYKDIIGLFLKHPIDTYYDKYGRLSITKAHDRIRKSFLYAFEWYDIYDYIEFVLETLREHKDRIDYGWKNRFTNQINEILEEEVSAYRIIKGIVTPISNEEEVNVIEQAFNNPFENIRNQIKQSLLHLSDRKNPDYRNSIKEAISAVEALSGIITKNKNPKLGQALKIIEEKIGLHPALKNAFSNLYGYTSDADGIRHALMEESNLQQEDALFMLITCSAFINYIIEKARKNNIDLLEEKKNM